jgi:hypothetical protein
VVGPTCQGLIPYAVFITLCFLSNKLLVVKTYGSWYTHKRRRRRLWVLLCQWEADSKHSVSLFFCSFFPGVSYKSTYYFIRPSKERSRYCYTAERERGEPMNIILFCLRLLISMQAHRPLISEACAAPMTAAASNFIPTFICVCVWLKTNQPTGSLIWIFFFITRWNHIPKWPHTHEAPLDDREHQHGGRDAPLFFGRSAINLGPFVIELRTPDGAKWGWQFCRQCIICHGGAPAFGEKNAPAHICRLSALIPKRSFETVCRLYSENWCKMKSKQFDFTTCTLFSLIIFLLKSTHACSKILYKCELSNWMKLI